MGSARGPKTVAQGDLQRLLDAIHVAFDGTAQPEPGEGRTTVWYLETGFQTTVPRSKRRFYTGEETDRYVVPPVAGEDAAPWVRDQASQIRDALLLARCQPHVGAFFNFELLDEDRLAGWQSGVLWRDGTHKASYETFRRRSRSRSRAARLLDRSGRRRPAPAGASARPRRAVRLAVSGRAGAPESLRSATKACPTREQCDTVISGTGVPLGVFAVARSEATRGMLG